MPNRIYRGRIINEINYAVKEAENAAEIGHPGLVGRIRELAAAHVFAPSLPSGFEIGTGKICDRKGEQSNETDLIIYDKGILPPVMYSERDGVFPIEACFYSIEVKSKSTPAWERSFSSLPRPPAEVRFTSPPSPRRPSRDSPSANHRPVGRD